MALSPKICLLVCIIYVFKPLFPLSLRQFRGVIWREPGSMQKMPSVTNTSPLTSWAWVHRWMLWLPESRLLSLWTRSGLLEIGLYCLILYVYCILIGYRKILDFCSWCLKTFLKSWEGCISFKGIQWEICIHQDRKGKDCVYILTCLSRKTQLDSNDSSVPLMPVEVTVNLHAQLQFLKVTSTSVFFPTVVCQHVCCATSPLLKL